MRLPLASVVLVFSLAARAQADEITYDLRIAGQPASTVHLVVRDGDANEVCVRREVTGEAPLAGRGRRLDDRVVVTFEASTSGVIGALQAQSAATCVSAEYRVGGGRIRGRLSLGDRVIEEEGQATPVPPSAYSFGAPGHDGERTIDLAAENAAVSARLRTLSPAERSVRWPVIVCPGLAEDDQTVPLHPRCLARLRLAITAMRDVGAQAILVSGGNVHPEGTPHDEALEMKRALLALGVPEDRIAIDPVAQHTTTNLRNAARFLFAHGLSRALVVTTPGQSFYVGHGPISTFLLRCERTLGYRLGRLFPVGLRRTDFVPSRRCLERGDDPLDP